LLQRKGRVLDAMADNLGALRHRSETADVELLDRLGSVTSQLASLVLNGPQRIPLAEHQQRIKTLSQQRETLENDVSRRSAGYYERTNTVTLDAIRRAIPSEAALVEFAVYRPFDPKTKAEQLSSVADSRYVAYVVHNSGEVTWKELGPARAIDETVATLRLALRDPQSADVKRRARALDERILRPLREMVGDATHLLISPDGQLDLIPFEALVDEQGRYLVERYSISYLTTGRDLLRLQVQRTSKSEPLVVADPLFGEPPPTTGAGASSATRASAKIARRSIVTADNLSSVYFAPLAGTGVEARTIKSLFPDARLLTRGQATKGALARTEAPRILHIATHGFFLNPTDAVENPLIRSGLALTGANQRGGDKDEGILTALEASNLNLWGTKLVTLSACDTGIGDVRTGEGVFGLRRAFFLAGAETLVMSLWPVSDYVTREMMTTYYGGLKRGLGRGDALRQAQLAMLARSGRQHPFYWASFIQAGEWANLDGRR
jgi:CHAT domain-containing protein